MRLGAGGAARVDAAPPKSEGQRLLMSETRSLAELAEALGVTRQAVHAWQTGLNRPALIARERLEVVCKIPVDAWARAAELGGDRDASDAAPTRPATDAPAPVPQSDGSKLGDIEHQLALVRAQRAHKLMPRELRDNIDLEHKLLERRDRLEREREVVTWARAKAAILAALKPYPEAARAVVGALDDVERTGT